MIRSLPLRLSIPLFFFHFPFLFFLCALLDQFQPPYQIGNFLSNLGPGIVYLSGSSLTVTREGIYFPNPIKFLLQI